MLTLELIMVAQWLERKLPKVFKMLLGLIWVVVLNYNTTLSRQTCLYQSCGHVYRVEFS